MLTRFLSIMRSSTQTWFYVAVSVVIHLVPAIIVGVRSGSVRLVVSRLVVLVPGFPSHFIFLFKSSAGIRKPCGNLCQGHLGDNGEHDLFALRRVRVFTVLVEPRLECVRGFPRSVFPPGSAVHRSVSEKSKAQYPGECNTPLLVLCFY